MGACTRNSNLQTRHSTSETVRRESTAARLSPTPALMLQMRSLRSGEEAYFGEGDTVSWWHHGVQETVVVWWK